MELSNTQADAVRKLLEKYTAWRNHKGNKTVSFIAPTGSGKTFMISHFVSRLFQEYSHEKIIVFLATLSMATLPKQFAVKVKDKYMDHLPFKFNIDYKVAPSSKKSKAKDYQPSLIAKDKTLLIVGRSSFTKSSLFIQQGCFEEFLAQIKNENYQLVYIRDEAHHGAENLRGDLKFEDQIQSAADFVIRMSATLENHQNRVLIDEQAMRKDDLQLLKTGQQKWNYQLDKIQIKAMDELALVKHCLKVFKNEVIPQYQAQSSKLAISIRPALLMQIKSESKEEENKAEFKESIQKIIQEIRKINLNYAVYFDKSKYSNLRTNVNLLELSANDSPIDVILFKVGPATGWDIPRACMLVQLRNIGSWKLIKQTIGRIKRYPMPQLGKVLDDDNIFNQYFIFAKRDFAKEREFFTYQLKPQFEKLNWTVGKIKNWELIQKIQSEKYQQYVRDTLSKAINVSKIIPEIVKAIQNKTKYVFKTIQFDKRYEKKFFQAKESVQNVLEFKKYLQRYKEKYFTLFKPLEAIFLEFEKKYNYHRLFFVWYLMTVLQELKNNYEECFESSQEQVKYQLNDHAQAENNYTLIKSKDSDIENFLDLKEKNNYLYNLEGIEQKQLLDSEVESEFFGIMQAFFQDQEYDHAEFRNQLVWGKNPNRGKIHFEYLSNNKIHRFYPDFIAKFGDYSIYIEIKALNDLNPSKTAKIEEVFASYIHQNPQTKLILSICKLDLTRRFSDALIATKNFSQIPQITEQLNIKYVFKELSKLINGEANDKKSGNSEN